MAEKKTLQKGAEALKFTKEQLAASARYADCRDLINALLEDGGEYTRDETDRRIDRFRKGKVN